MNVFISHISEETELAKVLKSGIESAFPNKLEVFVSSDDIDSNNQLDNLASKLETSSIMLVLSSQKSISNPSISFEAGIAWAKKLEVLSICHSGLSKDSLPLPQPLCQLPAIDIEIDQFPQTLMALLSDKLAIAAAASIDFDAFNKQISQELEIPFDTLAICDGRSVQSLLKEVEASKLILALATATEATQQNMFSNMSQRASELMQDDLECLGQVKITDSQDAQADIMKIAKALEKSGDMVLRDIDSNDEYTEPNPPSPEKVLGFFSHLFKTKKGSSK